MAIGGDVGPRPTAFYCASDSRHFVGAVALLNSLRLVGHEEHLFLIDAGLSADQRSVLAPHATLIPAPADVHPVLLAPFGPLESPSEVSVLLDVDIIVTRPLIELIELARSGRLVGFVNNEPNHVRSFPEWGRVLDLGPVRAQPYLNAGQLFVPEVLGRELFPLWKECQARVDLRCTRYGEARLPDPFYFADQDVLNAILATRLEWEQTVIFEHRLAPHPPFAGLRLVDPERLVCRYRDGEQPFMLHHTMGKPWLGATRDTIYSSLLTRLLLAPDVTVRLSPTQLPLRLRTGRLAALDRGRADVQTMVYAHTRRQLGRFGIRTRLANRRRVRR